jgi:MinD-like ATPase involved in chromosome partitioning or flagellar assembly
MICVLVLASGAGWESAALAQVDAHPRLVVLRRCMDVEDLLASATSGQAHVALVDLDAPGLDPPGVEHLRRHGVRPVVVSPRPSDSPAVRDRTARLTVPDVVEEASIGTVAEVLLRVADADDTRARHDRADQGRDPGPEALGEGLGETRGEAPGEGPHRVVAVWGPGGAPGRTTVAVNLAATLAARQQATLLVDADPYGGSVAQHLGVLDEASGLLQVSRFAGSGSLAERWPTAVRAVGPGLGVVTGLPRADRWREVRPAHLDQVVEVATARAHVVLDTGFSIEGDGAGDPGGRPMRNGLTTAALERADEVVVVGAADPVGLARLARALVELDECLPGTPRRVVVNRMRSSLGWAEREVAAMVDGFVRTAGLHFLPEDRPGLDRALVAGEAAVRRGDSAWARGIGELTDTLFPGSVGGPVRRRRALWRLSAPRSGR